MKFPRSKAKNAAAMIKVAASFRRMNRLEEGVVLFYRGEVCGWKNALRNPEQDRPNVLAVDIDGNIFVTSGGNDDKGAQAWQPWSGE